MLVHVAGVGFDLAPGDVTERFEGREAQSMLARGYAVPDDGERVERAVMAPPPEKRQRQRRSAA